ncbi:hypothetical protein Hanom_Chr12g01071021 [Helianthus anomalus]
MMLDVAKQEKDRIIRSRCINLLMMEITRMRRIWWILRVGMSAVPVRYRTGTSTEKRGKVLPVPTEYTAKYLSLENYEELFGVGHNDPKQLFAKDGIDSLFGGAESSYAGKETSNPECRESSAGEYHLDCDASSMLLMGDPPRCNPGAGPDQTTTPSGSRSDVVLRYKEKKKM